MVLDVIIDSDSLSIQIENPFHLDIADLVGRIAAFASSKGVTTDGLDIGGLIPKMIKGIAGCEHGCPADAKGLVSRGFQDFQLQYIEGGILSARTSVGNGTPFYLKMFPDF